MMVHYPSTMDVRYSKLPRSRGNAYLINGMQYSSSPAMDFIRSSEGVTKYVSDVKIQASTGHYTNFGHIKWPSDVTAPGQTVGVPAGLCFASKHLGEIACLMQTGQPEFEIIMLGDTYVVKYVSWAPSIWADYGWYKVVAYRYDRENDRVFRSNLTATNQSWSGWVEGFRAASWHLGELSEAIWVLESSWEAHLGYICDGDPKLSGFMLGEQRLLAGYRPDIRLEQLCIDAFLDACEEFPRQAENQWANLLQLIGMLFGVLEHGLEFVLKSVPDTLGNAWMLYRYEYGTGRSDVEQVIDYVSRRLESYLKFTRYDGKSTLTIDGVTVRVHCSFKARLKAANNLAHMIWAHGWELNLYTLWDLVPFSFMADWFTGTGDLLQEVTLLDHGLSDYEICNTMFSVSYVNEAEENAVPAECYCRWYSSPPRGVGDFTLHSDGSRYGTWIKRSLDVLALSL